MENNIILFDDYINDSLSHDEKVNFEHRLKSDKDFREDFRLYLFTLKGIISEAQQENAEFGIALKKINSNELEHIIGKDNRRTNPFTSSRLKKNLAWLSSIAAVFIVGIVAVFSIMKYESDKVDDVIVYYNQNILNLTPRSAGDAGIDQSFRNITNLSQEDVRELLPIYIKAYQDAPADDVQAQQMAGLSLVMAYIKLHDRKEAVKLLNDLSERFASDDAFRNECEGLLTLLR
ncbi:MAG: hypothetical protein K2K58_05895 [Muribaculaceae bacterium]|nr:hypothetical protein [Muribaculaceae bacterium]